MPHQSVERLNQPPLEFEGVLLAAENAKPVVVMDAHTRWFELSLYQCDDGGYVVGTRFMTTGEGEQSVATAERVDKVEDVENFFFAFEPDEYLQAARVQLAGEARTQLDAELYAGYEEKVREILTALTAADEATPHQTKAV